MTTPADRNLSHADPSEPGSGKRPYVYRPALDGLRALAVLPVLFYHANLDGMSGGFLGVDLFFVLSGYLITTLLILEWSGNGAIRLGPFWGRRARRLLPAMFLVIAAILVYALFAPAAEVARLRGDAFATLGYVANWWYAISGESYFEQFGRPSMLRHSWSLAIEEQFYFFWPLLLLFGLKRADSKRRIWIGGAIVGALLSAALMGWLYDPSSDPSRVYYGTDTRAQALLVGAALAFLLDRRGYSTLPRSLEILGALGLIACLAFFHFATDRADWMYRGGYILMAIAAAFAIAVAALGHAHTPMVRLLSSAPLVWIGARSYGLYLWHWPIYVLLDSERTGLHDDSVSLLLLRLVVTFVVSAFSYRWIEAPIRERRLSPKVERWGLGICVVGLAAAILIVTVVFAPSPKGLAAISGNGEVLGPITEDPEALRVLVVGDSVASTLAFQHPAVSEQGTRIAVRGSTLFGCGIMEGDIALEGDWYPAAERCEGWPALWAKRAEELKPHVVVVLLGAWEVYDRRYNGATLKVGTPAYAAYLSERLEFAIGVLSDQGKRPVVLLTAPCYQGQLVGERRKWKARNDPRRRDAVNRVIREVAIRHPEDVTLLDLQGYVCPTGEYQSQVDGVSLHEDGVHYTEEGAHLVWEWMTPRLEALARSARPVTP